MSDFFELIGAGGPAIIVVTVLIVGIFATIAWFKFRRGAEAAKPKQAVVVEQAEIEDTPFPENSKLGNGRPVKCVAIRPNQIIDFTTMDAPIGDLKSVDTSLPRSGAHYLVIEKDNGEIVDYEPREGKTVVEETPFFAYLAVHWKRDVGAYWRAPVQWWKSKDLWFAVGMMLIMGLAALVTLD